MITAFARRNKWFNRLLVWKGDFFHTTTRNILKKESCHGKKRSEYVDEVKWACISDARAGLDNDNIGVDKASEDWAVLEVGKSSDGVVLGERIGYFGLHRADYEMVGHTVQFTGYSYLAPDGSNSLAMWTGSGLLYDYTDEGHSKPDHGYHGYGIVAGGASGGAIHYAPSNFPAANVTVENSYVAGILTHSIGDSYIASPINITLYKAVRERRRMWGHP